uniref:Cobalamin biosynthesis protein CbiG n=1 Tax=Desulfatirhabdium butyrativorans TaxID=340467 RepID=A0A7C4VQD4_9BACT
MSRAERHDCAPIAVWVLTLPGLSIARMLQECLFCDVFLPEQLDAGTDPSAPTADVPGREIRFSRLSAEVEHRFRQYRGHVFIMACGIVVRLIAGLLVHKTEDPAVVVMDERAAFAISLVSGHVGGANDLARRIGRLTQATPVITTATDVHGKPAVDVLAATLGLRIENPQAIRTINRAFLDDAPVILEDPMQWILSAEESTGFPFRAHPPEASDPLPRVVVSDRLLTPPDEHTLVLRPPSLVVGIGCNRNTSFSEMREWIEAVFFECRLSTASIRCLASIDLKRDEAAIRQCADHFGVPCRWFSADRLNQARGVLHPSETVHRHVGVRSVCEAAALMAAGTSELIVPKRKSGNVTLAIARANSVSSASDQETSPTCPSGLQRSWRRPGSSPDIGCTST